jgi:hypothetical protein
VRISKNLITGLVSFSFGLYLLTHTVFTSIGVFTSDDQYGITLLSLIAFSTQFGIFLVLRKIATNKTFPIIILSIFMTVNLYVYVLVFKSDLNIVAILSQFTISTIVFLMFYSIINLIERDKPDIAFMVIAVLVVSSISSIFLSSQQKESNRQQSPTGELIVEKIEKLEYLVNDIEFAIKPNIYIYSFDSLIPESLLQKNLQINYTDATHFITENMDLYRNMFVDDFPTENSLNSFLALDKRYFEDKGGPFFDGDPPASRDSTKLFAGFTYSPFLNYFKENGYRVLTGTDSNYFGTKAGPYIDKLVNNPYTSVCKTMAQQELIAFFYYCKLASFFQPVKMKNSSYYVQHTLAKMLEYKTPTVALFYIFSPGHASRKHYRHDNENYRSNFRDEYIERSLDTKKFIEMILNHIKENDPNALLFIFGDHGPWLTTGLNFKDDPQFFIQSRFGVLGATYSKQFCRKELKTKNSDLFETPTKVAGRIIECLSGGVNPFASEPKYDVRQYVASDTEQYTDYLYE